MYVCATACIETSCVQLQSCNHRNLNIGYKPVIVWQVIISIATYLLLQQNDTRIATVAGIQL